MLPAQIKEFRFDYFAALLPEADQRNIFIDRAHRIPKLKQLPQSVPRDIITRLLLQRSST